MVRRGDEELRKEVEDILKRVSKGELSIEYATDLILRYAKNFYARYPAHRRKRY